MNKLLLTVLMMSSLPAVAIAPAEMYRSRDQLELALAWSDPVEFEKFISANSKEVVRSILNDPMEIGGNVRPPAIFQLLSSAYISDNETGSLQMLQSAIVNGADLRNRYENNRDGVATLFRTITPFELAVYLSLVTGKTAIVELLCMHNAHGDNSHEVIDALYEEVVRMHEEQYDEVDELQLKIVDVDEKNRMLEQFKQTQAELHAIVDRHSN